MINILVPTDFSALSNVAVEYAVKMANRINGKVTLLHVLDNNIKPTRASLREEAKALGREASGIAKQNFIPLMAEAEKFNKTENAIAFKIRKGRSFSNTIRLFSKRNQIEMIIMGTRGASGLTKYILGSNTVSVMEIMPIPVLAVPEKAEFKNFKNLAYASDLTCLEDEIKIMKPYLKALDATLHLLHVAPRDADTEELQQSVKATFKKLDYRKSTVTIQTGKKAVDAAIDSFVKELKADMVTMFTHKRTAYEKLFHRSMTRKIAFQSHVPLLTFKSR